MVTSFSGIPSIAPNNPLVTSTTQLTAIGSYMETPDGRGFRYGKIGSGAATVAGKVYQGFPLDATNWQVSGGFATAASDIGSTTVTTTDTLTIGVNGFAGGYMSVVVTPGQGYTYRIKSNTAATTAAVTVELEDPLVVALSTASNVIFVQHPYMNLVIEPGTPTANIAGVATGIIPASSFGWVQVRGACAVLFTGTGVAGKAVGSLSSGTSGSAAPAIAATNILGYHMATGITGEYAMIFLTIG